MPNAIELVTDRLILRPWRDADYEPFYSMSANPLVYEYLPPFPDRAASDAFVDHLRESEIKGKRTAWIFASLNI